MTQGKFGRILIVTNLLATLVLIATAIQGSHRPVMGHLPINVHVMLALVASLVILFAQVWVALYLISLKRELKGVAESRGDSATAAALNFPPYLGWLGGALFLLLILFLLGPAVLLGRVPVWVHSAAFFAAVAVNLASLVAERRALRASDQALTRFSQAGA